MSLFDTGDEAFKLAIHGASLALNTEMAVYNYIVWRKRGTAWHLISALVYGSCAVLEVVQVQRHVKTL
jgi:hypothetical protein